MKTQEEIDQMEMPCKCDCGNWFDLDEGNTSHNSNKIICDDCFEKEEKEIEVQQEVEDLNSTIEDAIITIQDSKARLNELGFPCNRIIYFQ